MYRNYIFDLYGTLVDIHTDEDSSIVWEKLALFYGYQGAVYAPEELKETYEGFVRISLIPTLSPKQVLEKYKNMAKASGSNLPPCLNFLGTHNGHVSGSETDCEKNIEETEEKDGKAVYYSHEGVPEIQIERVFEQIYLVKHVKPDEALVLHTCQLFRGLTTEYLRLYDGVHEMFRALKEKGKKIYLLSNAQRVFTEYELNMLDITKYFDAIMISSDYLVKKPDPSFFKILLDKYELNPEESIMIGNDENCDIAGAKRAGLDTYYIHSNISPDYTGNVEATYMQMEMDIDKVCRTLGII